MQGIFISKWRTKGQKWLQSILGKILTYLVLIAAGYILIFPVIFMISTSLKQFEDLANPLVGWIPQQFSLANYKSILIPMDYWHALFNTLVISLGGAFLQVASTAVVGYGFARFKFPGSSLLFYLVIFTIIVPPQTMAVPLFMLYKSAGWLNTYLPFLVPSTLGMGLRGGLLIFIFRQFFRGLPYQLEEAAWIEGAGFFRTFIKIMLPQASAAILTVFLFSFVWHWNDYFEPIMYLSDAKSYTLGLHLSMVEVELNSALRITGTGNSIMGGPMTMAATFLTILPPIIIYLFMQKYFVEGIERTGLTGQ
jgi:multiple sugar transport system permease protein